MSSSTNKKFYHASSNASSYSHSVDDDYEDYTPAHNSDAAGTFHNTSVSSIHSHDQSPVKPYSNFSLVPENLFQDACTLKHDALPEEDKDVLQNVTEKIAYQINFFSIDHQSGKKLKLICQLCKVTLLIKNVENHVQNQEHLRNLAKRCSLSKTTSISSVNNTDLEFLDYIEASQCYLCTLCNETFNSFNSCTEHFQNNGHRSKLKSSKNGTLGNPAVSHPIGFKNSPSNLSNANATSGTKSSEDTDQRLLRKLAKKLKFPVKDFELKQGKSGLLHLKCKVCKSSFAPESIPQHVQTNEHLKNLSNQSLKPLEKDKQKGTKEEEIIKSLRPENKEVGENLLFKLKNKLVHFQPSYSSNKLYFKCEVCQLKLLPKNVEAHTYTNAHLNNCEQNLSQSKSQEVFSRGVDKGELKGVPLPLAETKLDKKLNSIFSQLNSDDRTIFYSLGGETKKILNSFEWSNESEGQLNFICNMCKLSLSLKYVKSHFYNCTNVKDSLKNYQLVNLEDLNEKNQTTVKQLGTSHGKELYDFQLLLRLETKELYFFCKVCNRFLNSGNIKDHFYIKNHSQNLLLKPFSIPYNSLSEYNQSIVRSLQITTQNGLVDFDFVCKIGTEELRFRCRPCQVILRPQTVEKHIRCEQHSNFVSFKSTNKNGISHKLNPKPGTSQGNQTVTAPLKAKVPNPTPCEKVQAFPTVSRSTEMNLSIHGDSVIPSCIASSNSDLDPFIDTGEMSDYDKESLKAVIDNIGIKIREFQLMLKRDSNKLRLKCVYCLSDLSPESAETHINSEKHLKFSKSASLSKIGFTSFSHSNKRTIRRVYTSIGDEIRNYHVENEVRFVCKICHASLNADDVQNHSSTGCSEIAGQTNENKKITSEPVNESETLSLHSTFSAKEGTISPKTDQTSDLIKCGTIITKETHPVESELSASICQEPEGVLKKRKRKKKKSVLNVLETYANESIHPPKFQEEEEEEVFKTRRISRKIEKTAEVIDKKITRANSLVEGEQPTVNSKKPPNFCVRNTTTGLTNSTQPISCKEKTVKSSQKIPDPKEVQELEALTQFFNTDPPYAHFELGKNVENYFSADGKRIFTNRSRHSNPIHFCICLKCGEAVEQHIRNPQCHSVDVEVATKDQECPIKMLRPYFRDRREFKEHVVDLLTGNVASSFYQVFDLFEIFHEASGESSNFLELYFLCKECKTFVHIEILQDHCRILHENEKFEELGDRFSVKTSKSIFYKSKEFEGEGGNGASVKNVSKSSNAKGVEFDDVSICHKLFKCRTCRVCVKAEYVFKHLNSPSHLAYLSSGTNLESPHPQYYDKYKSEFFCAFFGKTSPEADNFEFFYLSDQRFIFCVPCRCLFEPASLFQHMKINKLVHSSIFSQSVKEAPSENFCALM